MIPRCLRCSQTCHIWRICWLQNREGNIFAGLEANAEKPKSSYVYILTLPSRYILQNLVYKKLTKIKYTNNCFVRNYGLKSNVVKLSMVIWGKVLKQAAVGYKDAI